MTPAWPPPFCGASASSPRVSPTFEGEGPQGASRSPIAFTLVPAPKAMTATLVAMLVEEDRLNWTTTTPFIALAHKGTGRCEVRHRQPLAARATKAAKQSDKIGVGPGRWYPTNL